MITGSADGTESAGGVATAGAGGVPYASVISAGCGGGGGGVVDVVHVLEAWTGAAVGVSKVSLRIAPVVLVVQVDVLYPCPRRRLKAYAGEASNARGSKAAAERIVKGTLGGSQVCVTVNGLAVMQ